VADPGPRWRCSAGLRDLSGFFVKVGRSRADATCGRTLAVTITPLPLTDLRDVEGTWPDEVADLTDRRRVFVLAVLGVDVPGPVADAVFAPGQPSSTTRRSGGRDSSTDDR
jgi:hypothetical protein